MTDFDMHMYVYSQILRELVAPYPGSLKAIRAATQLISEYKPKGRLDFDDYEKMSQKLPALMEVRLMEELL